MVERCDFLDSHLLSRGLVQRRTDDTVCALTNNILDVILLADVEGDLAGTALRRSARHLVGIGTGSRYGCRSRKRRKREEVVGEEVEVVLCRCSATWRGCDRSGRSDGGGVKCGGRRLWWWKRGVFPPEESLSPVTATSNQHCVCSRCVQGVSDVRNAACPIRPAVHVPRQPTTALLHPVSVHACKRRTPAEGYHLLFLVLCCDCVDSSVDVLLLLILLLSVEVLASLYSIRSALSSPFRYTKHLLHRHKPRGITPVSLQPPGSRHCLCLSTHLSVWLSVRQVAWLKRHAVASESVCIEG